MGQIPHTKSLKNLNGKKIFVIWKKPRGNQNDFINISCNCSVWVLCKRRLWASLIWKSGPCGLIKTSGMHLKKQPMANRAISSEPSASEKENKEKNMRLLSKKNKNAENWSMSTLMNSSLWRWKFKSIILLKLPKLHWLIEQKCWHYRKKIVNFSVPFLFFLKFLVHRLTKFLQFPEKRTNSFFFKTFFCVILKRNKTY